MLRAVKQGNSGGAESPGVDATFLNVGECMVRVNLKTHNVRVTDGESDEMTIFIETRGAVSREEIAARKQRIQRLIQE